MSAAIASFHLVREGPWRGPLALARLAVDRPALHRVRGLRFFRLLGTGRGATTSVSVDPRRTAMFAVWDDETALDEFLSRAAIARRWRSAEEVYSVRLRALRGHGTWRGVAILEGLSAGRADGPVAVLTRADVRLRRWLPFLGAGPAVSGMAGGALAQLAGHHRQEHAVGLGVVEVVDAVRVGQALEPGVATAGPADHER